MSRLKRVIIIFIVLIMVFSLVSCNDNKDYKRLYNDNKGIAADGDTYSFFNRVGVTEDKTLELKYSKFYGSETIWIIDVEEQGDIKIDFDSSIDNGMFKAVMITPLDEVVNIFEHKKEEKDKQDSSTISGKTGRYRLKIIGDNANGELKMQIVLSDKMKILKSSK